MIGLRNKPINTLAGTEVILIQDFEKSEQLNLKTGLKSVLEFPKSNVLIFESKDGTRVAIRPSGTEPKIKYYLFGKGSNSDEVQESLDALWEALEQDAYLRMR